ncbi:unnamed protein product, partial [Dovyalis caffra]
ERKVEVDDNWHGQQSSFHSTSSGHFRLGCASKGNPQMVALDPVGGTQYVENVFSTIALRV